MRDNIYISTVVFSDKNLINILGFCSRHGFTNIELGSDVNYSEDIMASVFRFKKTPMRFLLHNYFPPSREEFVLNLASDDEEILLKSMEHCKRAIDISCELGASFYSVHAGFAFHAAPKDLGCPQVNLARIPYFKAYKIFVESAAELAEYAFKKDVRMAVENNVTASFNLIKGRNEVLMLAEADEAVSFYKDVGSDNLFYLVDLGHLKVTSTALGFDRDEYLEKILPYTIGFHVNDNNGSHDEHLSFDENTWFKEVIKNNSKKIFIIEARGLKQDKLMGCYKALEGMLN